MLFVFGSVAGRWVVVPGGVELEGSEEFSGGGVDDADVEVVDEQEDVGSGVGSSDADVVESNLQQTPSSITLDSPPHSGALSGRLCHHRNLVAGVACCG